MAGKKNTKSRSGGRKPVKKMSRNNLKRGKGGFAVGGATLTPSAFKVNGVFTGFADGSV